MLPAFTLSFASQNCKTFSNYRIAVPGIKRFIKFSEKISGARVVYATVEKPSAGVEAPSKGGGGGARTPRGGRRCPCAVRGGRRRARSARPPAARARELRVSPRAHLLVDDVPLYRRADAAPQCRRQERAKNPRTCLSPSPHAISSHSHFLNDACATATATAVRTPTIHFHCDCSPST